MGKFGKMMSASDCDFIQRVKSSNLVGDKWYDWFIDREKVSNLTGDWFFGVVSLKDPDHVSLTDGNCNELSKSDLNSKEEQFGFQRYEMRIFTGGCYAFNEEVEEWEGAGMSVS